MMVAHVDLGDLGVDEGGHLLLQRALRAAQQGDAVLVVGSAPALGLHVATWVRGQGHRFDEPTGLLHKGRTEVSPPQIGHPDPAAPNAIADQAQPHWGLAPRGARVEPGGPAFAYSWSDKTTSWVPDAPRLYAKAAAAQWDPASLPWEEPFALPDDLEDAVVQVMTYLVENEMAALQVPARFLAQIHPHFREVLQVLAIQAADEARHIEVFARRAALRRPQLGVTAAGGQASLHTLVTEPDFAEALFLLSVLGEGSFLALLWFLAEHAPDPLTRTICRFAAGDEARHVAFGMSHLEHHLAADPGLRSRLVAAMTRRHAALQDTAGLNARVFDALVLLAAGGWAPEQLRSGWRAVQELQADMHDGRRLRLVRLGFGQGEAEALSGLHTRNFM